MKSIEKYYRCENYSSIKKYFSVRVYYLKVPQ